MRRATSLLALVVLTAGLAACGNLQGVADEEAVKVGHRLAKDLNGYVVAGKIGAQPVSMARVEQWLREPPAAYYRGREVASHQLVEAQADGRFVVAVFFHAVDSSFNNDQAWGRACLRLTVALKPAVPGVRDEVIDCPENAPTHRPSSSRIG